MKAPVAYVMWLANGRRMPWAVTNHQKCTTYLHQKCTTVYC